MKARHASASLLFIVMVSVQALVGQAPSSWQAITPQSSKHPSQWSQRQSGPFSSGTGNPREHLQDNPYAGGSHPPPPATFLSATRIESAGDAIYRAASGDFNGDGLPDVITPIHNTGSSTGAYLAVLLNVAGQPFAAPVLTSVSFGPGDFLLVADVNRDGKDDVVVIRQNSMDVLISMGDGTFAAPQTITTGINSPVAAKMWDVNHDKILDVVVVDGSSNQAAFLLGNGQGSFATPQMTFFPAHTSVAVLADLDADGNLDLVTNTALYPGDGNGGFLTGIPFQSSDAQNAGAMFSDSVAVGDLNGDGLLDVVTANGFWNTVTVFRNQGGRTLIQNGASLWSGNQPIAIAVADVNWDGKADLVVVNAAQSDFSVFLGKGDGTFMAPTVEYATGGGPSTRPVLADFNGDGALDVVLTDNQASVVLALGSGDGTFQTVQDANVVVAPGSSSLGGAISIASADFNGDGLPDFVIGQSSTSPGLGLWVFLAKTGGTLAKGVAYAPLDALSYVAVGDLNHDGKADIVASNWATAVVEVLRGNGDGTFHSPTSISLPGIANGLVVADLNGDGWPDVALAGKNSAVYILLNDGTGTLTLAGTYPVSGSGYKLVAADVNNDGKLDLCIAMVNTSKVAILLGNGNGTFAAAPDYDTQMPSVYGIASGDFNGDGFADLVVTSPTAGWIAIALGNGDGSFNAPSIHSASLLGFQGNPFPGEIATSDLDKDGKLDIVYANSGYGSVAVLLGDGSGSSFYGPYESAVGGGAAALVVADLNKDGWPDVVTADSHFTGVSVLYNTSAARLMPDFTVAANPSAVQVSSGGTAATTISVTSSNSFIGAVQLTCQNLPKTVSCTFVPSVVHIASGKTASSQLTIAATRTQALAFGLGQGFTALAIIPILGGMFFWRVPRALRKASALSVVAGLMLLSGCGGLAQNKGSSQIYTITVTAAASNGPSHSIQMQVTVQN